MVGEDDWKWEKMKEKIIILLKHLHENVRPKPSRCRILSHSSEMQNDALMHRQGLKG